MDNKINLNFYGVNYQKAVGKKKETETKEEETVIKPEEKKAKADDVLNAMALSGAQNKAIAGIGSVNPKNYLDEASIKRIQNSMAVFGSQVEDYLNIINAEFPNLSDNQKQELAYQAVLRNM